MEYIAFDAHKRYTFASVARPDGHVVREQRIDHERGALREFLGSCEPGSPVAVETIGHWYWIVDEIETAGCVPKLVHARKAKLMMGETNKTDRLDARMLAEMGRRGGLAPEPPADPERDALRALSRRRDQLVQCRKAEQTRLPEADPGIEQGSIEDHIAFLNAAIAAIDKAIAAALSQSDRLRAAAARLRRIPGIGPVTATVLLALMPELGLRSPKTIAALAGLAPINRDSGKHRGQRCVTGGRKRVRDALYMAAVAASRSHSQLAAFYKNLRAAGKPPKLAFVALARKLLTIANAIIRDGAAFRHA